MKAGRLAWLLCSTLLAGCGGGGSSGDGAGNTADSCTLAAQQTWLHNDMLDRYLFNTQMPSPAPAAFSHIEDYFYALLVRTDSLGQPLDRWSYVEDTASYNQFFGAGLDLGYGLAVAGRTTDPLPLRVRDIAPGSPAAAAGLVRGMVIETLNGQSAAALKAADDFSLLSPQTSGTTLRLEVRDSPTGPLRQVSLTATVYGVSPVGSHLVMTSPAGRKVGYLFYRSFIDVGTPALQAALADFASQGVQDLVLDLRYNGGGLVSLARDLASAIVSAPNPTQPPIFVTLRFNARHQADNFAFRYAAQPAHLGLPRVYVLSGVRTCSASELVVNGLKPFVEVVQIGATTCGKPFGFMPVAHCGNTYSAINFESVNANGVGGYTSGISPTCAVADDFDHALGDPAEALGAAALQHIDTGRCPPVSAAAGTVQPLGSRPGRPPLAPDGERLRGMSGQ